MEWPTDSFLFFFRRFSADLRMVRAQRKGEAPNDEDDEDEVVEAGVPDEVAPAPAATPRGLLSFPTRAGDSPIACGVRCV